MRSFRRRSRSKEPLFWVRNVFSNTLTIGGGVGTTHMQSSTVQNVDQLAVGAVTFSGIDESYTARRIRWPVFMSLTQTSMATAHRVIPWICLVKTSTSALTNLVGESLLSIMQGGSTNIPSALDVMAFEGWNWETNAGTTDPGFVFGPEFRLWNQFDVKVARRLQADECVAALSGIANIDGPTPAGSSIQVSIDWVVSTLYSRALRRR